MSSADRKPTKQQANKDARPKTWRVLGIASLLSWTVLAVCAFYQPWVIVTDEKNGEFFTSSYWLTEDPPSHPRLQELRRREKLDNVVAAGRTQFEKIVLLRGWVSRQWKSSNQFYYPPWDALEILDLARRHDNRGFCAQYGVVFLQACQSLGLHARYVDLPGHFVVGVWSDEHNRWVIMDPDNDVHYEKNGRPLRGRDLLDAYWDERLLKGMEKWDRTANGPASKKRIWKSTACTPSSCRPTNCPAR